MGGGEKVDGGGGVSRKKPGKGDAEEERLRGRGF